MLRKVTQDICAQVVGGSGIVAVQAGSTISGSKGKFVVVKPSSFSGINLRLSEEVVAESTVAYETKQESERRVTEILESETLFASLPKVASDPVKHILDLGNVSLWPYAEDRKWLHKLNLKIKHPSVTIETLQMRDGKHLVVILNNAW